MCFWESHEIHLFYVMLRILHQWEIVMNKYGNSLNPSLIYVFLQMSTSIDVPDNCNFSIYGIKYSLKSGFIEKMPWGIFWLEVRGFKKTYVTQHLRCLITK